MPCISLTMHIKASLSVMHTRAVLWLATIAFEYSHSLYTQLDTYLIVVFSSSAGWGCTGGAVDVGERITV